jgi:hypothetical protein
MFDKFQQLICARLFQVLFFLSMFSQGILIVCQKDVSRKSGLTWSSAWVVAKSKVKCQNVEISVLWDGLMFAIEAVP